MTEAAIPLPDDDLTPGLYRDHPLFSNDLSLVARYADQVLDRHALPSAAFPGLVCWEPAGRIEWRRLSPSEDQGAGSTTMLVGDCLTAWVAQELSGDPDAWEVAYAYKFHDLRQIVENEALQANWSFIRECGKCRSGMPIDKNVAQTLAEVTNYQGREMGDLLARWRIYWRHGGSIARESAKSLHAVLWGIIERQERLELPEGDLPLAKYLEQERDARSPLGVRLAAANMPSVDRVSRIIKSLREAKALGKSP